jgi:hypothetical protein
MTADIQTLVKLQGIGSKTDLINSASGSGTLNDANPSDTIVPSSLPTKMHVILDISNLNNLLTSNGTDITADTGSGTGSKIRQRRIDISGILVYTGEQVLMNCTKNGATDRNVDYEYTCGV